MENAKNTKTRAIFLIKKTKKMQEKKSRETRLLRHAVGARIFPPSKP
jgi:hypothetical protein